MDDEELAFKQKQREEAKKLEEARNKAAQKGKTQLFYRFHKKCVSHWIFWMFQEFF